MEAGEIARLVARGELSAREVTDAHIDRIQETHARLNAVVIQRFDEARADAAAVDDSRRRGEALGPLAGVPITIKEQIRVAGTQTTLGLRCRVGPASADDGPLVTRLRRAGAVVLGKTNVSQALIYHESDNPLYGRTNNPWDPDRTPGGSSGGETAIVAAGGSALGLGGDLGGSLRVPAHFSGVQSLKPTSRRLTNDDNRADLFLGGQEAIVPQQGPIARTVADLRLAMRVLAEPSAAPTTDVTAPSLWPDPLRIDLSRLRIGAYVHDGYFAAAPGVRRAVDEAADALRSAGAEVVPFDPPEVERAIGLFFTIQSADGGAWLRHLLGTDRPVAQVEGFVRAMAMPRPMRRVAAAALERSGDRRLAFTLRHLRTASAREYMRAIAELNGYRTRFVGEMDRLSVDALLCPPFALPALRHGAGDRLGVYSAASYSVVFNVTGMPAGVVAVTRVRPGEESDRPASRDPVERAASETERGSAGLPLGVQVVARHWREDVVLAVMASIEDACRRREDYPSAPPI